MKYELNYFNDSDQYLLNIILEKDIVLSDLSQIKSDREIFSKISGNNIIVSGKAPVFVYMCVALELLHRGAKSIFVKQAQGDPVKVFPLDNASSSKTDDIVKICQYENFTHCHFDCSPSTPLKVDDLPTILNSIPASVSSDGKIIISGKMPIWLAAAAAIVANLKKWNYILCDVPQFGCEISVSPTLVAAHLLNRGQQGIILGIVGDPNSGKSVFAKLLQSAGISNDNSIWCYDCDYAAPTSPWYLDMLKQGREQEAKELRQSYKRKWIPGAEDKLAEELKNIAKEYELVIADLPGGRHDISPVQRIPYGREALILAIDAFIIIGREDVDYDTGAAWNEDLKKIGRDKKIVLTVYSENPDSPLALNFRNGKWYISGLSRTASDIPNDFLRELWDLTVNKLNEKGFPGDFLNCSKNI